MMRRKKIAVIGGGIAGIGSVSGLEREGLEPACFERSDKFGGTWCYRKETRDGQSSIMPTTIINHSKEMGAFSMFPPKKEYSNYLKHSEMYEYICDFVKARDIAKYIHLNTEVLQVKKSEDYAETGRWHVKTKNVVTGIENTDIFDGVLVCTGHINKPIIPDFPGKEIFNGTIMHTHTLKEVEGFENQNVVIVGTGCSAVDAAVEISRVAKQVYLSTRTGAFIINRVGPNGYPFDTVLLRRYMSVLSDILPTKLVSWYLETFYLNTIFDQKLCHVESKYHFLSKEPISNDHIGAKFLSGAVIQKGNINHFTEKGVVFHNEEHVTAVDTVVMATGYTWSFPFLEDGVIVKEEGRFNLYKCMYPTHLPHPTLALIGFFNPFGAGFPLGEMQIRWAAYLLAKDGKLPPEGVMRNDVIKRHKANSMRYHPSEKLTVRVEYIQYMDEIANQFGVKPKIWKYLFTDFPFFIKLVFGPTLPYQYRLDGHGKWEGAREAIMTSNDRILWPLRKGEPVKKGIFERFLLYLFNLVPLNIHIYKF